jgi:hypothetical protein
VLRRVHARSEEELERALDDAVGASLVEERSAICATITYRFSHVFFQQTLYDELMAPRRIGPHQQVAYVLEEVHARQSRSTRSPSKGFGSVRRLPLENPFNSLFEIMP